MYKEEKSLIKTNGIFYKISHFFRSIFSKKTIKKIEEEHMQVPESNSFKGNISINPDEEQQRLLNLQLKIRKGNIQAEELSDEDIEKLNELYDKQIDTLRETIKQNKLVTERYRQEIVKIKSNI